MHTGRKLAAPQVEKGHLNCDSDAPQGGSAGSDSTRVVKLNRHKTNCHKRRPYCFEVRPYCVYISNVFYSTEYKKYVYVFTVISITKQHKIINNCLPMHNATLVQKVNSQNYLSCIEPCHILGKYLQPVQQGMKSASFQVFQHVAEWILQKVTEVLASHPNIQTPSLIILHLAAT
jgi:hypothetical protein